MAHLTPQPRVSPQRTRLLSAGLVPKLSYPASCSSSFFHTPYCFSPPWRPWVPWDLRDTPPKFLLPCGALLAGGYSHLTFGARHLARDVLWAARIRICLAPLSLITSGTYLNILSVNCMDKHSGKRMNSDTKVCQIWTENMFSKRA